MMQKNSFIFVMMLISVLILIISSVSGASVLDYTLKIYGNANMDEDINDLDVSYLKKIIAGNEKETAYADANHDGFVNDEDISQIQQLIDGTASTITLVDDSNRIVTVPHPANKIVCLWVAIAEPMQAIGAADKIIAIDDTTATRITLLPEISKKEIVGKMTEPDIERLISLDPDIIFSYPLKDEFVAKLESVGIPVVSYSYSHTKNNQFCPGLQEAKQMGFILDAQEGAEKYTDFAKKYLSQVEDKVSSFSPSDRPDIMYTYKIDDGKVKSSGGNNGQNFMITFAGGHDITSDTPGDWIDLDPEFVIKSNPEYIFYEEYSTPALIGYGLSDPSGIEKAIENIKSFPGFHSIDAVKDDNVYSMPWGMVSHCQWLTSLYLAKLLHPYEFEDMDVPSIHQEYMKTFLGLGNDVYSNSIFIYPFPEGW